jgi:hypothetical protein
MVALTTLTLVLLPVALMSPITLDMTEVFLISYFSHIYQDGWGLKGNGGRLHHNARIIQQASKTFKNHAVGLLLNMDNFTLEYFINGEKVLTFSNPDWKVLF